MRRSYPSGRQKRKLKEKKEQGLKRMQSALTKFTIKDEECGTEENSTAGSSEELTKECIPFVISLDYKRLKSW